MIDPQPIPPKSRRKHRWLIGCATVVVALLGTCLITGTIAGRMWASVPEHWEAHQRFVASRDPADMERLAEALQNRVPTEVSAPGNERRTITLGIDEANAWLDRRLGDWLAHQGTGLPPGVSEPMLATGNGRIIFASRIAAEGTDQIFSVFFNVDFQDDGRARLRIDSMQLGRLSVPASVLAGMLDGQTQGDAAAILLDARPFDPVTPIDGSRQTRLLGIEVYDNRLELEVVNEPRP